MLFHRGKNYSGSPHQLKLDTGAACKILLVWLIVSILVLSLEKAWSIVAYILSFGVGYGGLVYFSRHQLRERFSGIGRSRFPAFLMVAVAVSVTEELYVHSLGNSIAISNVWLDIIVVPAEWAAWFTAWYFVISRHFSFTEKQALLCAGLAGIIFEYSGKGFLIADPLAMAIFFPTAIVVYAAIFILPMQFIKFSGTYEGWLKYPAAVFLPYAASIPVGLILYFTLLK